MREVLGLVNFLSSIITNCAALLQPLHSLLSVRKDQPFDPSPTPFPPLCQERPTFRSFIHFIPSSLSGKTNLLILHPLHSLLSVRKDQPFNPSLTLFPPLCQGRSTFRSFTHSIPSSLSGKTNLLILHPFHSLLSVRKDQPFNPSPTPFPSSVRKDQPFDPSPTPFPPLYQERPTFRSFTHSIPSSLSGKTNLSILHPLHSLLSVRKDQPFDPSPTPFPSLCQEDQPFNPSPTPFPPLCQEDQPFNPSPTPFPPLCQERPTFRSFNHFIPSSLSGKTNLSILHPLHSLLSVRKDQPFDP